ncbi:diguanylate cyclase (GGDEF)-like protein [Angulomicrobium tetraedrale]|uniref:diguanylate cyclase n=1 Tax=Ancylobacter tetraedralis TaxID=217068 RepID=A0A839ZBC0_9HYPH|nr:sensor domain-containing diguanylate cyclase [Ancylobacter tetraedralis]MBB3772080.1 diguanylate cyclase (GGDEF)-like protein [Ancylobacter tetraedralis]
MWQIPELPANEPERLAALFACDIMDTPREERFDRLTWLAQRFYCADVAFLSFVDAQMQWMKSVTSSAIGSAVERRRSVCQVIISDGRPLVVGDLHSDARFDGHPVAPQLALRFYAGVPLLVQDSLPIGSLCILREKPGIPEGFDIAALEKLASIAADELSLRNLNRDLTRLSRRDALTGLGNRRCFDEELERARLRCQRLNVPLTLLMIDIDRFKDLNDHAGHRAGDEVLRRLGVILSQVPLRADDVVARYGGEEFALILSGGGSAEALPLAERIRHSVRQARMSHPTAGTVTLSIGIASQPADAIDTDRLIVAADRALYAAKRAGRDAVMSAPADDRPASHAADPRVTVPG